MSTPDGQHGVPRSAREDLVRLWFVVFITLAVSLYWLAVNFLPAFRLFWDPVLSVPAATWFAHGVYAGMIALLWLAHSRWRESIQRSRELQRVLTSLSPMALVVVSPERAIVSCNTAVQSLFGYSAEELIGLKTDMLYSDRRINPGGRDVHTDLDTVGFHTGYATARTKKGVTFAIELTTVKLQGAPGAVILIRDITEQKRTEQVLRDEQRDLERRVEERTAELWKVNEELMREVADRRAAQELLRRSEATYRTLTESSPDMVCLLDRDGRVLFANARAAALTGQSRPDMKGKGQEEVFDAGIGAAHREMIRTVVQTLKPASTPGPELLSRTGVWLETQLVPIVDEGGGAATAVLSISRDVTERRRITMALRESEENFRALVENATSGIMIVSAEEKVLYANRRAAEITGNLSPEYLTGTPVGGFLAAAEWNRVRGASGRETSAYQEATLKTANGTEVPVDLAATHTLWQGQPGTLLILNDITYRKHAEAQMIENQKRLRVLASQLSLAEEKERRRIATSLHDGIGQTLALCKIRLGAAMASSGQAPENAQAMLEVQKTIDDAIRQTRTLTVELSPPVLYEMGLEAALEWLAEQMEQQSGTPIHFRRDAQPKPLDDTERVVLFQAARELVVNAIKHARARQIRIATQRVGAKIHLTVEDNGVGFAAAQPGGEPRGRSGFGLFYIRERLTFLGGMIVIDSRPGHGTRVTLVAPLQMDTTEEATNA
jgi:PAS domain S-box-containing protein